MSYLQDQYWKILQNFIYTIPISVKVKKIKKMLIGKILFMIIKVILVKKIGMSLKWIKDLNKYQINSLESHMNLIAIQKNYSNFVAIIKLLNNQS
jgi:hypothetical protein